MLVLWVIIGVITYGLGGLGTVCLAKWFLHTFFPEENDDWPYWFFALLWPMWVILGCVTLPYVIAKKLLWINPTE